MSYVTGYVVYGVLMNQECWEKFGKAEACEDTWKELQSYGEYGGFEIFYNEGCESQGFCGVILGSFNECRPVALSSVNWQATFEQEQEAEKKIAKLYPPFRAAIEMKGADHYILWQSS